MDLTLGRPAALFSLAVPAILILVARARRAPRRFSALLELWPETPAAGATRRRWPRELLLALAALVAAAAALCDPSLGPPPRPGTWTLLVDGSPSMDLEGGARREAALARARERIGPGPFRVVEDGDLQPAVSPLERVEPDWRAWDRPGTVWLTDRIPPVPRRAASLVATGGGPVPGPVAGLHDARGWRRIVWDGERLSSEPCEGPGGVWVDAALADPVRVLTDLWREARGFAGAAREDARVLRVDRVGGGARRLAARIREGGVELSGSVAVLSSSAPGVPVLWAEVEGGGDSGGGERLPAVLAEPGALHVAFDLAGEPRGDPAALAVRWAGLCDRAARGPDGVAPLAERRDAGPPRTEFLLPPPAQAGARRPLAAPLALVAAILAGILSVGALRERGGPGRRARPARGPARRSGV